MLAVHVRVRVKPDCIEPFKTATIANALRSREEPGIARFDLVQDLEDPTRFLLLEVYRDDQAPAAHKQTAHYAAWRDTVAPMMAETRTSAKYATVSPDDASW